MQIVWQLNLGALLRMKRPGWQILIGRTQRELIPDANGTPSGEEFVTLLYRIVQGRQPDPSGLAFWSDLLGPGVTTRGGVLTSFSESPEFRDRIGTP